MVNHVRNLLLNAGRDRRNQFDFGEHYVPENAPKKRLPSYLNSIRRTLFGSDPDRCMLNYRLHQFMTLLHSTELSEFVTAEDTRITYLDVERPELLDPATYVPVVRADLINIVQVFGSPEPPDLLGHMRTRYVVRLFRSKVIVEESTTNTHTESEVTDLDFALGGSGYRFRLNVSSASEEFLDGPGVEVDLIRRPQWDLGQIAAALESRNEVEDLKLFGVGRVEPYLTFRNLWNSDESLPHRLGAYLLAVAFRTAEVVNG